MTKREVVIFFAGVEAFHTLSHLVLSVSGQLPMRVFGFNVTAGLNVWAIVVKRGRVALTVPAYGMRTQLQPVRLKTHALLGSVQKPSHVGASARWASSGTRTSRSTPLPSKLRRHRTVPGTPHR